MRSCVVVLLLAVGILSTLASAKLCPFGWRHYPPTDECYRYWASEGWNITAKALRTYDEAAATCARYDAELPIVKNASHADFLMDVVGRTSGRTFWLQPRDDLGRHTNTQYWTTNRGRHFTEFFEWDKRRGMPGIEACLALQAKGDITRRIVGGNAKMLTADCFERFGVVCAKQRVPVHIGAVNVTSRGIVDHIWGRDLVLKLIGGRIPVGTRVTLQTTNEDYFATAPPRHPTNCSFMRPMHGDSVSVRLNVTSKPWSHHLCNGTCDEAELYLPASTPFVRGARYSFCFFVPIPFADPLTEREYGLNLLPDVFLEIVQAREEYLQDVCTRYQHNVQGFYGAKHDDTHRDIVRPYYFNSRHA